MDSLIDRLLALDPRLRRVAARMAADTQEAEDLVQEVWLAVLSKYPGEDCALEPWALAILRNQAARRTRRQAPVAGVDLESIAEQASQPPERVERGEVRAHLLGCIQNLPEPYRGTLIERFYSERSVGEIAAQQGLPRATVSTHLRRALDRLRRRMGRANDFMAWLPGLRWPKRSLEAMHGAASRVSTARWLALAAVTSPLLVALAWVRVQPARAVDEVAAPLVVEASLGAPDPGGASRAGSRTRVALVLPAKSLHAEVRSLGSKQPLAGRTLVVSDSEGIRYERSSDAQGRFELPIELASQWLVAELEPQSMQAAALRFFARSQADSLLLAFGDGPLLRARFEPPSGLHPAELELSLRSPQPGALTSPSLQLGPGERAGEWLVQLPSQWNRLDDFSSRMLHVATPDGLLAGEARISSEALNLLQAVAIEFEARATLELSIAGANSAAMRSTGIRLQPVGAQEAWIAAPDDQGHARLAGMHAGKYQLEVLEPRRETWSREVELRGGARESVSVELRDLAVDASRPIRGRIVRAREGYDGAMLVALEGGPDVQFRQLSWTEVAQGFEARFEFPHVGSQALLVRPIALDGLPRFDPPCIAVSAYAEPLEFTVGGRRSTAPITCEVRAAGSEQLVERLELRLEMPGGTQLFYRRLQPDESGAQRWAVASHELRWKVRAGSPWDWLEPDCPVSWRLSAAGFESQSGDQHAWEAGCFRPLLEPRSEH